MKKLIIAEKQSVGKTIAKALGISGDSNDYIEGGEYIISWGSGHLIGLVTPDEYGEEYQNFWTFDNLPIIPSEWKFGTDFSKMKRLNVLKKLMSDPSVDEIICATDAGREGECIFRYIYNYLHCRKPVKRLWLSSMKDTAIREAIAAGKLDKVFPMYPHINYMYMVLAVIMIVFSVVNYFLIPKAEKDEKIEMEPRFQLFLMMLPIIALAFVFSYLPLYGWRYAFFDYKSGETLTADNFVGLKWFTQLFQHEATIKDIGNVLKNTLAMSGLGIATSWIPMVFAVFLSEIKNMRFRRFVQTFTTIPNFISWVLVYAIALAIFSTDGFINTMLTSITGENYTTNYLMSDAHMWLKMLAWGLWKGVGWSAIIYIAAISGIDQGLYEAATVDGAGRFAKMWYITIPELIPTYCVLLLMSVANILSNGMDQYLRIL